MMFRRIEVGYGSLSKVEHESARHMQVLKRTLQTALVWTLYEELKPFLMQQAQRLGSEQES